MLPATSLALSFLVTFGWGFLHGQQRPQPLRFILQVLGVNPPGLQVHPVLERLGLEPGREPVAEPPPTPPPAYAPTP